MDLADATRNDNVAVLSRAGIEECRAFRTIDGESLLSIAVFRGAYKCVQWLVCNGWNINQRVLFIAARNLPMVKFLVELKADIHQFASDGRNVLESIVDCGSERMLSSIRFLIKRDAQYTHGWKSIVRTYQGEFERNVAACKRAICAVWWAYKCGKLCKDLALYLCKHFLWPKRKSKRWNSNSKEIV